MKQLGFCVHGHFYQPSREDPLTGEIPEEKGAFPYKNWNELIYSHCYLPNSELGNYRKISFNFGPTLLDWMVKRFPVSLSNIIAQDRENYEMHGVGNALAQPYITPSYRWQVKKTKLPKSGGELRILNFVLVMHHQGFGYQKRLLIWKHLEYLSRLASNLQFLLPGRQIQKTWISPNLIGSNLKMTVK
jgi:hypothetical protein